MSAPSLALLLALQQTPLTAGLAAASDGRYEEAVRLLQEAEAGQVCPYDCLVALGLSQGRLGRLTEARRSLDRALALDPPRPEALVERGGLLFLEARYDEAAKDLDRALAIREDAYTRDLLASALHLAGRSEEALRRWNAAGLPIVQSLRFEGLSRTRDEVARREVTLAPGEVLDLRRLRESRARLEEVGVFDRVTLRPVPLGEGRADLEVALSERYGFGSLTELLVGGGVGALQKRLRLRYANLGGSGVTLGGQYRWQQNRPEAALFLTWPRPFGAPVYLRVQGDRGRQAYDLGGRFESRYRGLEASVRGVLGERTVGGIGLEARDRSFSRPRADTRPGALVGWSATIERRLVEGRRIRATASLRFFQATRAIASDVDSVQLGAGTTFFAYPSPPEGRLIERSVLAVQLRGGWSSTGSPLDRWFAPGASPEMDLPLRAHRRTREGVLGETPLGRSIALANVEWRRRFYDSPVFGVGAVLFCDLAHIGATPENRARTLQDVGVGVRLKLGPASVLRFDYGHGLADGNNALSLGIGQLF